MQRVQVDHFWVYHYQIKTVFNVIHAIIITLLDYIYKQISNAMFMLKRDIYIATVLKIVSLVDNKARVYCYPTWW